MVEKTVFIPHVSSEDSVYYLKLKIQEQIDIAPNRQRVFQGITSELLAINLEVLLASMTRKRLSLIMV